MHSKTTRVTIEDRQYEIRRMTPAVGSYIWQRLMHANYKLQQMQEPKAEPLEASGEVDEALAKVTPEDRLRTLCGIAFLQLDFKDLGFAQNESMKVVSRVETNVGVEAAMPLMTGDGIWAATDVAEDLFLVTRLTVEALVFNLLSFLDRGSK